MSEIDTRVINNVNCYGRKLGAPGELRYTVGGPGAAALRIEDLPFTVRVAEAGRDEPRQHDVTVTAGPDGLTASPPVVEAAAGDVVVWTGADDTVPPFVIWGDDAETSFASFTLDPGTFFSHVFGSDGNFGWRDRNGSGLSGVVHVRSPEGGDTHADVAHSWARQLSGAGIVLLTTEKAEPPELEIVTGQTVFFVAADVHDVTLVGTEPDGAAGAAS